MKANRVLLWVCLVMAFASASAVTAEVSIVGAPERITLELWAKVDAFTSDEVLELATSGLAAVAPVAKLTTTWGEIKQ